MGVDIPVIWFAIIVFATLMYIIMDGFDLGIVQLCGRCQRTRRDGEQRRTGLGRK